MSEGRYDLAGVGSMVVDAIQRVSRIAGPDEKVLLGGGPAQRFVGGVVLNQLGWARLLGLRVAIFGKQGDDPDGAFLRAGMERLGIEPHLDLSGSASSFAEIHVDGEGRRAIYMARAATAELTPEEVERLHRGVIERARVVSTEVSQVPLAAVRRVLELARAAGARTVVDLDVPLSDAVPALGSEAELHAVLELADWLKPSLSAVAGLVAASEPSDVARELALRYRTQAVIVTAGERGAVIAVEGRTLAVSPPKVQVLDSTGAGDAFLGGLLAGLHYGLDWRDAARLGNACGAACCERIGAFPDDAPACRARALELYRELSGRPLELPAAGAAPEEGGAKRELGAEREVERFLGIAVSELRRAAAGIERAGIARAVALIRAAGAAGGRVHVTGVGKPEHVARYAAALLSSTGTPAVFLHATEATHGSVGQLRPGDVLIALSNSGETPELLACVRAARALEARLIAICRDPRSSLGREAEIVLPARVEQEGGTLGLAPRASVLAQTLVCAALSVALEEAAALSLEEYNRRHPAGELGRRSRKR